MEFILTERMALFLKRCIEINIDVFEKEIEQLKEMDEINLEEDEIGPFFFTNYSDTLLNIEMKINFHFMKNPHTLIFINYGKCILSHFKYDDDYKTTIDTLVKKFIVCKCGKSLPKKDDWCQECFPYVVTQENNCCVCLENEGVWIKLAECNHILHSYCWYKTLKRYEAKCPLCRTINSNWEKI
jgi:hypothetical protein